MQPISCYYRPERSEGDNDKIRVTNESFARKMNIITIITHFQVYVGRYCYSLQNPKNFRMREPCEFSNDRWPDVR